MQKYRIFKKAASITDSPEVQTEMWFLSAYHLIEACAAKARAHIQKHQKVPDELARNPSILGSKTSEVAEAFIYLDNQARAKFVYGDSGSDKDLEKARRSFETIETACLEVLG